MKLKYLIISTLFISTLFMSCMAQKPIKHYTESKKAIKYLDNAISFFQVAQYDNANDYLNKAIEKDSNFIEAYLLKADICQIRKDPKSALELYKKILLINADYRPHTIYQAAVVEMDMMLFRDAAAHLRQYLVSPNADKRLLGKINNLIDQCDFAADLMDHPVDFNPINLGDAINSEADEYVNAISTENDMIIFTVKHKIQNSSREVEDFFYSTREPGNDWNPRQMMGDIFNTADDEGAMVISPNGKLIVFASNRPGGYGRFDLYYSVKDGKNWTLPVNMGNHVNTEYWESQPSISSDGRTIFFVSDRKGGFGGSDIYFVTLQDDNTFGNPFNIGAPINTAGNEMTPFIHLDAKTLYFVSSGHLGMGKSDVFVARKDKKGIFSSIQNLGYPINTIGNELGIVVDPSGQLAYISSDISTGKGGFDIYSFHIAKDSRPIPVTYLKGITYDAETKQKLKVDFKLIDLETGEVWIESESDKSTGEFLVCVPSGKEFGLNAYHGGYLFYSDHFNVGVLTNTDKPFLKDVPMIPLKSGRKIILKNILFATNSYDLRPESTIELNKLKELLIQNPSLKIEISGHTDNIGDDVKNQILSENRAKAVYNFLINNGITSERLTYIGYGETQPVASNGTPEGQQENRRTEIKIIGF